MDTSIYNNASQIVLTIDDHSLVKRIADAVKLIKGVTAVQIKQADEDILQSASYKAAIKDLQKGNVSTYDSADDLFDRLMNEV